MKKLIVCFKWIIGLVLFLDIIAVGTALITGLGFLVYWSGLTNLPFVRAFLLDEVPLTNMLTNFGAGCLTVLLLFVVGFIALVLTFGTNEISQAVFNSKRNKCVGQYRAN